MRNLGFLLLIGLLVYCVIDITRSDDDERMGVHPALWVLVVLLFPLLGSIVWLAVSRTRRSTRADRPGGQSTAGTRGPARRPPGPLAPDDDPEFLWRLDQQRRNGEKGTTDDGSPTA